MQTLLLNLFTDNLVQAFCWMLVHSLWQGLVFTIFTGLVLMATTQSKPTVRYNLIAVLFFLFLITCGITFFTELTSPGTPSGRLASVSSGAVETSSLKQLFQVGLDYYAAHTSWVLAAWAIFFCWKAIRLTGAVAYNYQLKAHKLPITNGNWNDRFAQLVANMGIRQEVAFFESAIIKIPVVIGHLKPVVFLPVGVLTQLSPAEVEAVLLHELAHIRRKDYLVNLVQLAVESVFFFNPALLWISAILREERENCCDDLAIATTRSKKEFIQALVSFREHAAVTGYTMAFPAGKNQLLKRVSRIVHDRNTALDAGGRAFFIASLLLLGLVVKATTDTISSAIASETAKPVMRSATASNYSINTSHIAKETRERKKVVVKKNARRTKVKALSLPPATAAANTLASAILMTKEKLVAPVVQLTANNVAANNPYDQYRIRAERDRLQAEKDRAQAALDRIQAEKDREQAMRDRIQAIKDRAQADKDRQQAERDRKRAEEDRARYATDRSPQTVRTGIEI